MVRKWTTEEDVRNNLINCGLLLNNLAIKAMKAGGRVIKLIGNHEMGLVQGDNRDGLYASNF